MHASTAREESHKQNILDIDRLNDRFLDGIDHDIHQACSEGKFSIKYDLTVGLSLSDLLYCQDKLEEGGYKVAIIKEEERYILDIDWSRAEIDWD